jgi:hypothetical protein
MIAGRTTSSIPTRSRESEFVLFARYLLLARLAIVAFSCEIRS